ncbi:MAG: amidase [Longimicrobiales bacterium]|nr:amidase [Longimicrobiales bacterium]
MTPSSPPRTPDATPLPDRRAFLSWCTAAGLGGTLFPGALWARAQEAQEITRAMVADAEKIAGIEFSDEEREMMLQGLSRNASAYARLREQPIPNGVMPALHFDPQPPGTHPEVSPAPFRRSRPGRVEAPGAVEEVAFWPVAKLSELVRTRQLSSEELTRLYLDRLERHGPTLEAVITITRDRALRQARQADREIALGQYRGPLHGIPWGAKDLLATADYPTTWGAMPYRTQQLDIDAAVVERLDDAGAVLVAKLTLGALAQGDVWFGGRTRNPWNLEQGSSGSSAGPAAATVAGLVGFGIGSETLGSIVSPATRCGATGLRPTYGRVSRYGAMALSWSMDKLGPLCRSVEDCALVLDAIHGADPRDPSTRTLPFPWDAERPLSELRVGFVPEAFEEGGFDARALEVLRGLGVDPIEVTLPTEFPLSSLRIILSAEAAAAFDELTRSGRDDELTRQTGGSWPNTFRTARMIPAVEYIQANRVRTMVMGALDAAMEGIDVLITPSFAQSVLLMTNLTGHPAVVVPHGFDDEGSPTSFSFVGKLWREEAALRLAKAFQDATDHHLQVPPLFAV